MYRPLLDSIPYSHSVGKILCVGRNYVAHAKELNNPIPNEPVLFIKPATSACDIDEPLVLPQGRGSVHHELEVAVLIGRPLTHASEDESYTAIAGIGLGLDLTLRDLQSRLKEKGLPWERAKSFDRACPLSGFVSLEKETDLQSLTFSLLRNQQVQQQGNSQHMLFPILSLIAHISEIFTLNPGDIVMTGTPAGVGELVQGDELTLELDGMLKVNTRVAE